MTFRLSFAFFGLFLLAQPAFAQRGQDVLMDKQWAVYDRPIVASDRPKNVDMFTGGLWAMHERPWVISDGAKSADLFGNQPYPYRQKDDLFAHTKITAPPLREEVLRVRKMSPIPYGSPIFSNDHWTN